MNLLQKRWIRLIYPARCLLCDDLFSFNDDHVICMQCAPLVHYANYVSLHSLPFGLDGVYCVFDYHDRVKDAIIAMKFFDRTDKAVGFAELMADFLKLHLSPAMSYLVVPVPLHGARQRERGFNQSAVLAQQLCKRMNRCVYTDNVMKIRATTEQSGLDREQRRENLQDCFRVTSTKMFENANVIIIDDVYTTGATVSEMARTLKKVGARTVVAATPARSP